MAQLASTVVYGNLTSTGSIYMGSDLVATQNWVSSQGYCTTDTNYYVNGVSGSGNGTLTICVNGASNVSTSLAHSHTSGDLPSSIMYEGENVSLLNNDAGYITSYNNYYLTAANFDTGNGVLSLTVNGTSNVSEDLDGRYAVSDSNVSFNKIQLANHEQGDYTTDGDFYHDASAGFYGYSSNNGGTALLWDNNNVSEGSHIGISYASEGCPTINVDCVSQSANGSTLVERDGDGDMCGRIVYATSCFYSSCAYINGSTGYHLKIPSACGCAVDFVATSDCRFKKNIEPVIDALSKVDKLCGICYDLCMDNSHEIGLIAQDVEKIEPRLVTKSEPDEEHREKYGINDVSYGLKYDKFSGLFVEAIKELKKKDIEQQRQIITLQNQINKLEEKINNK